MTTQMHYLVNVSGGLTSFEALDRALARFGKDNTTAVFADTKIEDADLYRFLDDQERYFGITIHRIADGRTPFDVWHDERLSQSDKSTLQPVARFLNVKWLTDGLYNISQHSR